MSDVFGTTTRDEDEPSERVVLDSRSEGGSTGSLGVGVKRWGRAAAASSVSKGK